MTSEPIEPVDIFNDFDDPEAMVNTFCKQVSESQYQEDIRSETDKALGELCLYMDQNPDVYARVLRKRKQEEMEASGVFSFVKSKMMILLHGERYPQCLVTTSDCIQNTNALKAGMCKTFQLSQELKGNVTRQSTRLAAKRQAKTSTKNSPCDFSWRMAEDRPSSRSGNGSSILRDSTNLIQIDRPSNTPTSLPDLGKINPSNPTVNPVQDDKGSSQKAIQEINSEENGNSQSLEISVETVSRELTSQPALLEVSQSVMVPVPPTPPPLPANFNQSSLPKTSEQKAHPSQASGRSKLPLKQPHTPENQRPLSRKELRSSPRTRVNKVPTNKMSARASSFQDLSSGSSSASSPFLTPDLPTRYKTHKRSQSNSSLSSNSSWGSFSSIHSEMLSANPISRLKATQVVRSPGGTPARQDSTALPSEPFHKALYTALRTRFQNVNTPSPRSGNSTINGSNKSLLNNTFSP